MDVLGLILLLTFGPTIYVLLCSAHQSTPRKQNVWGRLCWPLDPGFKSWKWSGSAKRWNGSSFWKTWRRSSRRSCISRRNDYLSRRKTPGWREPTDKEGGPFSDLAKGILAGWLMVLPLRFLETSLSPPLFRIYGELWTEGRTSLGMSFSLQSWESKTLLWKASAYQILEKGYSRASS